MTVKLPVKFNFTPVAELLQGPKLVRWLIRDWLEAGSLALLFGDSAAGKTFLALDWAACIASGRAWNGLAVSPGPIFYIAGEGKAGLGKRLQAWSVHNEVDLLAAPIFVSERGAALMDKENAREIGETVRDLSREHGSPALVIVDTLHRNMGGGDENSAEDVGAFLQNLDSYIRAPLGCSVLLVHHSGHGNKDRSRGSSSIRAALDAEFSLKTAGGNRRELECTKQKDAEPPLPLTLEVQKIFLSAPWLDSDTSEPLTSLVLAPVDTASKPKSPKRMTGGTNMRRAIDWFRGRLGEGADAFGEARIAVEDGIVGVADHLGLDRKHSRERAREALDRLLQSGDLCSDGDWLWLPQ